MRLKQLGGKFWWQKKKSKSTLSWKATPNHQPSLLNKPTQVKKIKVAFGNMNLDLNFKCLVSNLLILNIISNTLILNV